MSSLQSLLRVALRLVRVGARQAQRRNRQQPPQQRGQQGQPPQEPEPRQPDQRQPGSGTAAQQPTGYAGDFEGIPTLAYEPVQDDRPDPGEVVWAWVPYEEDHSQGKDRPVLVIGRDGNLLLALQMSSQDHDQDAEDEARWGRRWVDVGSGAWDRQGRPSEARVDRILRLDPSSVRRIGAVLDRERFDEVASAVAQHAG